MWEGVVSISAFQCVVCKFCLVQNVPYTQARSHAMQTLEVAVKFRPINLVFVKLHVPGECREDTINYE